MYDSRFSGHATLITLSRKSRLAATFTQLTLYLTHGQSIDYTDIGFIMGIAICWILKV